jgi:hypothetical protein
MGERAAASLIPAVTYENSYVLPSGTFHVSKVKQEVDKILKTKFDNVTFDPKQCGLLLREATDEATKAIRRVTANDYKYSVQFALSEKIGQAFFSGTMCLWDPEHDNYMTTTYENSSFMVVAIVFGTLLE